MSYRDLRGSAPITRCSHCGHLPLCQNLFKSHDYCYRLSSVVCLSVGRSVTIVSPTKTAEPTEMPMGCGLGWAEDTTY